MMAQGDAVTSKGDAVAVAAAVTSKGDTGTEAMWQPSGVSFSSGGVRIIAHIGILAHLVEKDVLRSVRHWYGCSGGSISATAGALGMSAEFIRKLHRDYIPSKVAELEDDAIFDYFNTWGISDAAAVGRETGIFMDKWIPGSSNWTFADFVAKRPGVTLTINATNLTQGKIAIFNHIHTPTMRIVDAIHISSTIPMFYKPWVDPSSGDVFCDGAVLENYPWECVDDKDDTLVIACSDTDIGGRQLHPVRIGTLAEYFSRILLVCTNQRSVVAPRNWIAVNNRTIDTLDFHISEEDRYILFKEGELAAERWLAFQRAELMRRAAVGERPGCSGDRALPCTSSSGPRSPDSTSDTLQSGSPVSPPFQHHSPQIEGRRPCRRWSL